MSDKVHLGHRARKRFGQNFLHDPFVISQIVDAINPQPGDNLVEIGPGLGALTEPLCEAAGQLTVVELDRDLAERLRAEPRWQGKLQVIESDVLRYDFSPLIQPDRPLRVVGNLPYNISTPLMFHLLAYADGIRDMHFMLQKEVVERLVAGPGSKHYGRLGIMIQYHCRVEPVLEVAPGAFKPPPKVDSAVVRLVPHTEKPHVARDPRWLEKLVVAGFGHRRKTIRNGFRDHLSEEELTNQGIKPTLRPENLSLADYVKLANYLADRSAE